MMEEKQNLATGHARTAFARARMRNDWIEVAQALNSDENGCVKDWKQWAKYWKDKKASVKRKASFAEAARQKTVGGDSDELELTQIELKILAVAGYLNIVTGDRPLSNNTFPELDNQDPVTAGSETNSDQWESLLIQDIKEEDTVQEFLDSPPEAHDCSTSAPPMPAPDVPGGDETKTIGEVDEVLQRVSDNLAALHRSKLVPSRQGRTPALYQRGFFKRRRHEAQAGRGVPYAPQRRPTRRIPQTHHRSQLASLTEKFIAIEERQVNAQLTLARSQEMYAKGQLSIAEAISKFTDTIKIVAEHIIGTVRH